MTRDDLFAARKDADGRLFIANHCWAAHVLHPVAPAKYAEAAQAFRVLADTIDAYAAAEDWATGTPHPDV